MGQILYGSAKTTHPVRTARQRSKASIKELAGRYDLNPKTVIKWRKRTFVHDAQMGPKTPHSTVLSGEAEAPAYERPLDNAAGTIVKILCGILVRGAVYG
jgi:transposase-like protein